MKKPTNEKPEEESGSAWLQKYLSLTVMWKLGKKEENKKRKKKKE